MESYAAYWNGVKEELRNQLNENELFMWINNINYEDFDVDSRTITLSVPSKFILDNVEKYNTVIKSTLSQISGYPCVVNFLIKSSGNSEPLNISPANDQQSMDNKTENSKKSEHLPEEDKNVRPYEKDSSSLPMTYEEKSSSPEQELQYSFDNFIIGNSNEFAAHAAKVVARSPGTKYNPYFIWGESGLGKTHLLKAIKNYVEQHYPSKKVVYITSEKFTNDFVNSIRSETQEEFRIRYRKIDVLLIDDVQFFANKQGIQGEVFNTWNALYDQDKQMVFSCDQPISKVKAMEERLKGRFAMGLTVDLRPPDYELKMAILESMCERNNLHITDKAMEYIATNINGNIRELQGAFRDLMAFSDIMKINKITLETAQDRLKDKITNNMLTSAINVNKILKTVSEHYHLTTSDMIGEKRTKSIAYARQIAMYISRKLTKLSTTQIGKQFGNREHGTVMHAVKKIEDLIQKNDGFVKSEVNSLINKIKSE